MDLQNFITQTLLSIVNGIGDAQDQNKIDGFLINPTGLRRLKGADEGATVNHSDNNLAQKISFDIAVSAEDAKEGGAKINVLSVGIGGSVEFKNSMSSRVQFTIPILFRGDDIGYPGARSPNSPEWKVIR